MRTMARTRRKQRRGRRDPQRPLDFDAPPPSTGPAPGRVTPRAADPLPASPPPAEPRDPIAAALAGQGDAIDDAFCAFVDANPHFMPAFLAEARLERKRQEAANRERIARGEPLVRVRLSAKRIFETLRAKTAFMRLGGDGFKLNNNYTACAARLAEAKHPDLKGLFRLRVRAGERTAGNHGE